MCNVKGVGAGAGDLRGIQKHCQGEYTWVGSGDTRLVWSWPGERQGSQEGLLQIRE